MCSDAHSITLNEAAVIFKIHFLLWRFIFNTQVKKGTRSISKYQELLVVKNKQFNIHILTRFKFPHVYDQSLFCLNMFWIFKVILCASEHICSIVRYCFRSFKQL